MATDATQAPVVSVVIPAFENESTLGAAIESVLTQQGPAFELIVSDHASTDGTLEIARAYEDDPRVTVASAPSGGGAVANWNHVSALASAPLLKLVCGDDVLAPGVLARQVRLMDDPGVALVACRRDVIDGAGRVVLRDRGLQGLRARMTGPQAVRAAVRSGTNPFGEPSCVMMRTATLAQVGWWWGERPYVLDLATYVRVLEHGDFAADPATGAAFRLSTTQQSARMTRRAAGDVGWLTRWAAARHPEEIRAVDRFVGAVRRTALTAARAAMFLVLAVRSKAVAR